MSKKNSKMRKNTNTDPRKLARELARQIDEKKGNEIVIFDLRGLSPLTDYFVIANGLSDIHNRTIAEYLIEYEKPNHIEGFDGGHWILLDYIDVIVHIFLEETRRFYGLERLWGDAAQVDFKND